VDTDGLSLHDQVELFSKTRYLAGIHGAGLTNLFFRKNAPLTLLELLPGDYIQPHYFWLCKGMGHDYDCIAGTASAFDTSFEIDPLLFENKLSAMLG
jgi:capsular polysaccharide biosynthesis protein